MKIKITRGVTFIKDSSVAALHCGGSATFQETSVSPPYHVSIITLTNDPIPYLILAQMDLSCFHNAFRSDLGLG